MAMLVGEINACATPDPGARLEERSQIRGVASLCRRRGQEPLGDRGISVAKRAIMLGMRNRYQTIEPSERYSLFCTTVKPLLSDRLRGLGHRKPRTTARVIPIGSATPAMSAR